jgi:hypothetical protein
MKEWQVTFEWLVNGNKFTCATDVKVNANTTVQQLMQDAATNIGVPWSALTKVTVEFRR